jgi:hypothetical protein
MRRTRREAALAGVLVVAACSIALGASRPDAAQAWSAWYVAGINGPAGGEGAAEGGGHLVISEVMTGGASASDEFIEIYNPTPAELPLEGLELVYVSASGATVSVKGEWLPGAPGIPSGGHLLVANEAGTHAAVADVTYASGLAAAGGSVALRMGDAVMAIDAVGWGTAASAWLEGAAAPAVAAGHSLERLPGGAAGSGQDSDDNAADFADRPLPDPQNASSSPIPIDTSPAPSPSSASSPIPTVTPTPTSSPTLPPTSSPTLAPTPTPTPTTAPVTIGAARLLPDGTVATVEGISVTDSAFTDGGGYVSDATGGIAVIVADGSFARGQLLRITGEIDDRFHQRTLRTDAANVAVIGQVAEPEPMGTATGGIDETVEGQLVAVTAAVASAPTQLSGAVAYDIDDGSGPARVVILDTTGIDHSSWMRGTFLELHGVVGQRDSSGTGAAGYRLQPRGTDDVVAVTQPTPSPAPTGSGGGSSPSPSEEPGLVSIATAREAAVNSRLRVRGVVTLASSVLGDGTAAIQDATGAIILRLGDEAGSVSQGEILVVDAKRSTKSGMETLLVSTPPERRGTQAQPAASRHATGDLGEDQEALLISVRGEVVTSPRRTSAQNVYFDLDDGTGPLRVYVSPRTGIATTAITLGATLELAGILGQETSGQQPQRGYRLWPRAAADVKLVAGNGTQPAASPGSSGPGPGVPGGPPPIGVPGGGAPPRAIDLPVPRLVAARHPSRLPTPTPRAHTAAAVAPQAADGLTDVAPWLAVAAAVLGGLGAVAAARPGLLQRLRDALARPEPAVADAEANRLDEPRELVPGRTSPLERTAARLVPLAVIDDQASAEAVRSAAARSGSRRILPPT